MFNYCKQKFSKTTFLMHTVYKNVIVLYFYFSCIVAGAQKLIGPAGVTIVIVHEKMLGKELRECPTIWNFKKQAEMESRLNTPPCYR